MNIALKKFNMKNIPDGSVIVLIGKRKTGKSILVKDLLYYHKDIPVGTIISGTEGSNKFYSSIAPSIFIHNEYTPEVVHNFVKRQTNVSREDSDEKQKYGKSSIDPRAFLLLDDCLHDNSWAKNKDIRYLFMNGRHANAMFITTMQYCMGIPPGLRTNIDYVFLLREPIVANRRRLYEQYAGMFPSFDIFCQVMDQSTSNYECLVIDNNCQSNKLEDMVFWYKADMHEDFKIGHPDVWQFHSQNYANNFTNNNPALSHKRRGPVISVKKVDEDYFDDI